MRHTLRASRRIAPWIAGAAAPAALVLGGLHVIAMVVGGLLTVALLADAASRTSRREIRLGGAYLATVVAAAVWTAAGLVALTAPGASATAGDGARGLPTTLDRDHVPTDSPTLLSLLIAGATVSSGFAIRSLSPLGRALGVQSGEALAAARAIVDEHGEDSLSPFVVRPDKRFVFAAGAVLAYRRIGETIVVSADPVGPEGSVPLVLERLLEHALEAGLQVVLYGCSDRHLDTYRRLGLRAVCAGEEAVVDPSQFTLQGRSVRKLRQSVHRVARRGWRIAAVEGRDLDVSTEREIEAVDEQWCAGRDELVGFSMSMGGFDPGVRPSDLYLLAWSPDGELRATMRFLAYRGNLSLDTMRRVGETPNGLNEALICEALRYARAHGIGEVSLNYAGLAHVIHGTPSGGLLPRCMTRAVVAMLHRRFQMDRLVLFNEKFSPRWRLRYLVFQSRAALPRTLVRVLQAEGYLPHGRGLWDRVMSLSAAWTREVRVTWRVSR